jgi:putative peptidoglycan lipid II flippase
VSEAPDPSERAYADAPVTAEEPSERARGGRLARSTALFSAATALSRVAGLVREIVAASLYGVTAQMSAFTIAFQVPNLVRSLFADAAIQAAFVPVFTEQLEQGNKREAFRLASSLIFLVTLTLGALTALFVLLAPLVMPLFVPSEYADVSDLVVSLSRLMFPIIVLLGMTGMVVGILNSYDRFGAFAIAPLFWNLAIIAVIAGLVPAFPDEDEIYAYAIGVLVGTLIQLAIPAWDLRRTPYGLRRALRAIFGFRLSDFKDSNVRRILVLMLPVTISLGLININLVINSTVGFLVSDEAPAAIDKAFRIYMLPQGMFSVAIATVLFPTLARYAARADLDRVRSTMANGIRQILLLLVPAAAAILVLSEPMTRLVYERGVFDARSTELVSEALFWFAFSLPASGIFLLQTRTFFSLQRPWVPTLVGAANLAVTALFALLFYEPFGIGGIVAATSIATIASALVGGYILHGHLGRLELGKLISSGARILIGATALAAVAYFSWEALDDAFGRSLAGQLAALGLALGAGAAVYGATLTALRVPEMAQVVALARRR